MRNTYLTVGIIVVILVIVAFAFVRNRLPQFGQVGTSPTPTPVVEEASTSITVSTHTPASTAVVDKVTLAKSGFVAIHEQQNGQVGGIIGASELLQQGSHENVVVQLTRKTANGETLIAMIHTDNGDGTFDPSTDEATKDENDQVVQANVQVSSDTNGFQVPATGLGEDNAY